MLLPFLILALRLAIFTVLTLLTLALTNISASITNGFALLFIIPLSPVLMGILTAKVFNVYLKWLDQLNLPNGLPGKKYLEWRKKVRTGWRKKYLIKWIKNPASFQEGVLTFVITLILLINFIVLVGIAALSMATNDGLTSSSETTVNTALKMLIIEAVILYGVPTFTGWYFSQRKFNQIQGKGRNLTGGQPTISSSDVDQELSKMKQQIMNQDGYTTEVKRKPKSEK